ncbi:hypothetical protein AGMMS49990_09070 [Endomicrobiia bacterium]|nr:hypothetical protein AGMMS49990_09070 [Endomicrobiia bacterium]
MYLWKKDKKTIRYMANTIYEDLDKIHTNTLVLKKEIKETPTDKRR